MSDGNKPDDLEMAAIVSGLTVLIGGIAFWLMQVGNVFELLELAYGTVKFFNNPLVF